MPRRALLALAIQAAALRLVHARTLAIKAHWESLCPDSQHWILKELQPIWNDSALTPLYSVELVTYGNAVSAGGAIKCQHGAKECAANTAVECASSLLAAQQKLPFVFCTEGRINDLEVNTTVRQCAPTSAAADSILACAHGARGVALSATAVEASEALENDYVPWVTVNGAHVKAAEDHLKKYICDSTPASSRPQSCTAVALLRREEGSTPERSHSFGCPKPYRRQLNSEIEVAASVSPHFSEVYRSQHATPVLQNAQTASQSSSP